MPDGIEFSEEHHAIFGHGAALTAREKVLLLQIDTNLQTLWGNVEKYRFTPNLDAEWAAVTGSWIYWRPLEGGV